MIFEIFLWACKASEHWDDFRKCFFSSSFKSNNLNEQWVYPVLKLESLHLDSAIAMISFESDHYHLCRLASLSPYELNDLSLLRALASAAFFSAAFFFNPTSSRTRKASGQKGDLWGCSFNVSEVQYPGYSFNEQVKHRM